MFTAIFLAFASLCALTPMTPRGLQCPTAPVQEVVVAKRDCCDRVVGYEVRKPREGERGFLQCRCAEKRAAQHGAADAVSPREETVFVLDAPPALALPRRLPEPAVRDTVLVRLKTVPSPPSVRPPAGA